MRKFRDKKLTGTSVRRFIPQIILAVFLLALLGLGIFTYTIYRNHPPTKSTLTISNQDQNKNTNVQTDQNASQAPASDNPSTASIAQEQTANTSSSGNAASNNSTGQNSTSTPQVSVDNKNVGSGSMLAHITTEHCVSGCKAFANDLSLLEYCQEVCGIIPVRPVTNCDGQSGIDKDYCEKDLAVTKNDPSICNQINDVNVKQTCQNRIAQDIIESQ
jgi:hypothetical protein